MDDPRTLWLTVVNVALGAVVVLFCALVVAGVIRELLGRASRRRTYRAELNHDMEIMFGRHRGKGHWTLWRRRRC